MADLVGVAAIVAVISSPMIAIFAQYNARKKIKEDSAAAMSQQIIADLTLKQEELKTLLAEQTGQMARIEGNTDGGLTEIKAVAKHLGVQKDALALEVERLQPKGAAATPEGVPTAENPVGMVSGHAKAYSALTPAKPSPEGEPDGP